MNNSHLNQLIDNFSIEQLTRFFKDIDHFRPVKEDLPRDGQFKHAVKIGELAFESAEEMVVCAFEVDHPLSERSGKLAQFGKAKEILKKFQVDAGIFVFFDDSGNFRFSLVYNNYQGIKRKQSNPRRFTYFVSKELTNKTFLQQIGSCDFSTLDKIKDAFSVEKVTSKFFEEFRLIFDKTKKEFEHTNKNTVCLWLKDKYSDEEYSEQINKFTFTFLGRLIFLYFLLRKGWIEDQKDFIRKIIDDKKRDNLYLNVFQPLFFNVFATKEPERNADIRKTYQNTPYLNGGLFERSDLENEMLKSGKFILFEDKFIRELITDFFEAYNFTVDENSPNDQEVSIDPEMLGKVFENTLAEEERGKKGTFYTPREVVHFMVKDALLQFLINETSIDQEYLHRFIYEENFDLDLFVKENVRLIDAKLDGLKVLDPAVGSAAFPVEMMQVLISLRKRLSVKVGKNISEVSLKKSFIKNNLYGVDIDPSAIEIAKLRLWLSLIVDYDKADAEPLPNLDFQFRVGNSLQEKIDDIDIFNEVGVGPQGLFKDESEYEKMKDRMITIKDRFYLSRDESDKRKLKDEFDTLEHQLIQAVLEKYRKEFDTQLRNQRIGNTAKVLLGTIEKINSLEQKIKDGTYKLFKPDFHFSEVFDRKQENGKKVGGFDIVIGNPPYGVAVDDDIKEWHALESTDSYGVFISTALKRFLKPNGVLEFIVSDTWLTIKSHRALRYQVLQKRLHKVTRLHQDCFDATVNACILCVTNSQASDNTIIAADLTNISTRVEIGTLRDILYNLKQYLGKSKTSYAVYGYSQSIIELNSNLPIFVASSKIYRLTQDINVKTVRKLIQEKEIYLRQIEFNGKVIDILRFGDMADVRKGIDTGNNSLFLFSNPGTRGNYRDVEPYRKFVLTDEDLSKITSNNELRIKVSSLGIYKSKKYPNFDPDLWFCGRYIVPYSKGGESDVSLGWLPNYFVPSNYFIDWSQESVSKLYKATHNTEHKATLRNKGYWFMEGLTFSLTGVYAPTIRLKIADVFDNKSSGIFLSIDKYLTLGIICSKLTKYLIKNYFMHTVDSQVGVFDDLIFSASQNEKISSLVAQIIKKQEREPKYDYMSNEQKEIDKLVYEMYSLNEEDIDEIETWYARRYPKLARFCEFKE